MTGCGGGLGVSGNKGVWIKVYGGKGYWENPDNAQGRFNRSCNLLVGSRHYRWSNMEFSAAQGSACVRDVAMLIYESKNRPLYVPSERVGYHR